MITVSRAAQQADFPARFQLIAAMNPCPCGYLGDRGGRCNCTSEQVKRYRARISGPLLDRIDMTIEVPNIPHQVLLDHRSHTESSASFASVCAARARQVERAASPAAAWASPRLSAIAACGRRLAALRRRHRAPGPVATRGTPHPQGGPHRRRLAGLEVIETPQLTEAITYRRLGRKKARSPARVSTKGLRHGNDPAKCAPCQMPLTASRYAPRPPTSRSSPRPRPTSSCSPTPSPSRTPGPCLPSS